MLRLNSTSRRDLTAGEMVNLMSVDVQKLLDVLTYLNMVWSGPLQVIVSLYFIYRLLGYSTFVGFVIILAYIPVNIKVSAKEKYLHSKQMIEKDSRLKLTNEILAGIKVLKMYAWEKCFLEKVTEYREAELKLLKQASLVRATYLFSLICLPFLVSCLTFTVYVLVGNELTAEKAFVSIALFNIIRFPLFILPRVVASTMFANVTLKRLSKFLKGEELELSDINRLGNQTKNAIEVHNGIYSWGDYNSPVLKNINIKIKHGSLTAIVGRVGTGKSSLLSALLGEIERIDGEISIQGTTAYVAQLAWIQNTTFKDNILFDKKYNKTKYEDVISACALNSDIDVLPDGDATEIGEKGINLSGGQKQRLSIARAVYNNADIYLLDDPLSAVDAHVGHHIFQYVIGRNGLLRNKTRVLVTHNLNYLPQADQIIVLKDNRITEVGTYKELVACGGEFAEFLQTYVKNKEDTGEQVDLTSSNNGGGGGKQRDLTYSTNKQETGEQVDLTYSANEQETGKQVDLTYSANEQDTGKQVDLTYSANEQDTGKQVDLTCLANEQDGRGQVDGCHKNNVESARVEESYVNNQGDAVRIEFCGMPFGGNSNTREKLSASKYSLNAEDYPQDIQHLLQLHQETEKGDKSTHGGIIEKEKEETGRVKRAVFLSYVKYAGVFTVFLVIFLSICSEGFLVGSRLWLAKWSSDFNITNSQRDLYLEVYGGLGFAQAFSYFITAYLLVLGCVAASRVLHNKLLFTVLHLPMSFFDTTPMGRIINRFAKDINIIDEAMPRNTAELFKCVMTAVGTVFVILYATPIFVAVFVPIAMIYYLTQVVYI